MRGGAFFVSAPVFEPPAVTLGDKGNQLRVFPWASGALGAGCFGRVGEVDAKGEAVFAAAVTDGVFTEPSLAAGIS